MRRVRAISLYALSGAAAEAFSKFPMPRVTELFGPTFRGEEVVRLGDVTKDERFGKQTGLIWGFPRGI